MVLGLYTYFREGSHMCTSVCWQGGQGAHEAKTVGCVFPQSWKNCPFP